MITASILGRNQLDLGPANVYIKSLVVDSVATDWADDTDWIDLGYTESLTMRMLTTKADLMASQVGTRPADKVITGQQVQIETSLGKAYLERLENIQQGLQLVKETDGTVTQWKFVKKLGQRDSDVFFWVKVVKFNAGAESTDPLDTAYAKASPASDTVELTFDAATQRFYAVMFEAYENDEGPYAVVGENGEPAYSWSGDAAA